jgi:small subunit ribosomal protein S6
MHRYEVLFILRPDTPDDEIDKTIAQMEGYATAAGGKLEKTEKWGRRKLAYRVRGQREGFYALFVLEGTPHTVSELERRMKVADAIVKFLTIRIDEEQKRAAKMAQLRAKRLSRQKPKQPAPAHASAPHAAEAGQV